MNELQEKELQKIKERYSRRNKIDYADNNVYYAGLYSKNERDMVYAHSVRKKFGNDLSKRKIIEIGAGTGSNLLFFNYLGFKWGNIFANELLESRYDLLRTRILPSPVLHQNSTMIYDNVCVMGDALQLSYKEEFDIVLQSTVFTSILDITFRKALAVKMWEMLKPGGIVLSYDFTYNNPKNKDVVKLTKREIKTLFQIAKIFILGKLHLRHR